LELIDFSIDILIIYHMRDVMRILLLRVPLQVLVQWLLNLC
jgi:hypothetical protein